MYGELNQNVACSGGGRRVVEVGGVWWRWKWSMCCGIMVSYGYMYICVYKLRLVYYFQIESQMKPVLLNQLRNFSTSGNLFKDKNIQEKVSNEHIF